MSSEQHDTRSRVARALKKILHVERLVIDDQTQQHAGHPESRTNKRAHLAVLVVSPDFIGKKPLERHRMIYQPLKNEFKSALHALAVQAFTPEEFARSCTKP